MPNKNPRYRMVAVPRDFMPLLEAELQEKGYWSYPQLMNEILTEHFNGKGTKSKTPVKATVRKVDE